MSQSPSQPPSLRPARRADAERNRDKILVAARSAFADPAVEISMAEISRRAGVGMATLYRNFPGRRELLQALYTDEIDAICHAAQRTEGETPGTALLAWLNNVAAFFTSKHEVGAELLKHTDGDNPFFGEGRSRVLAAGQPLLTAAQQGHEIRADLTLEQILEMIHAIAAIKGDPTYVQPILNAALDGLRR
jgi:AcrR family transcriptional regulator